ncbi:MAG: hypothetical protein K2X47_07895, partial [Bdellovibrionales bacterium]|nr:hypothetical protein [Bdellovibrionales bacterium]
HRIDRPNSAKENQQQNRIDRPFKHFPTLPIAQDAVQSHSCESCAMRSDKSLGAPRPQTLK